MAFRTLSSRVIASSVLAALAAGGTYGFLVHRRISATDASKITIFDTTPDSFQQSLSVSEIVNARKHQQVEDSRFITLEIPPQHQHITDEVLLARFAKGYFGGLVLSPERILLKAIGLNLTKFTTIENQATVARFWSTKDLSDHKLPPLHSVLYGVFQVLDIKLPQKNDTKSQQGSTESYIDFGFGRDQRQFVGVHRFSVVRPNDRPPTGQRTVQIHRQSMTCNPTVNRPVGPGFLYHFHNIYAQLLFREAVAEVSVALNQVPEGV
ncbi:hypothetical protein AK830_g11771 [Neonectria ditissima]|uniref:Uncharacterized protein n=1 Tax=Neonectria ditissima TaxID=78410 RepID=A0A0P7B4J7_9HYPO|nr:hypothetical protein AK830_g11771 [Neonectria ditissima]